jgi:hypothetical protein
MSCRKIQLMAVCWALALGAPVWVLAIPDLNEETRSQAPAARQDPQLRLAEDQARLLVKEIPSINVQETLSRWAFPEKELNSLRQWSTSLVQQPSRRDFLPQWCELISKAKTRNANLGATDVKHLIQMLMSSSYEEANKGLDSLRTKSKFLKEMQGRISENLLAAERLQVLVRPQLNDPSAGVLIRLPSYNRALQRCREQTGPPPHLECTEVLIATTIELDDYMATSAKQLQDVKDNLQKSELELQKKEQARLQTLEALSETSKAMYEPAMTGFRKSPR